MKNSNKINSIRKQTGKLVRQISYKTTAIIAIIRIAAIIIIRIAMIRRYTTPTTAMMIDLTIII